jgi:hypothetical protein
MRAPTVYATKITTEDKVTLSLKIDLTMYSNTE